MGLIEKDFAPAEGFTPVEEPGWLASLFTSKEPDQPQNLQSGPGRITQDFAPGPGFTPVEVAEEDNELPFLADLALGAAVYGGTALGLGAMGAGFGALGTAVVAAPIYVAAKSAILGKVPVPSFIPSEDMNGLTKALVATGEETALWALGTPILKGVGKGLGVAGRAIDKVSRKALGPLAKAGAPVSDWMWKTIQVPIQKDIPLVNKSVQEMLQPAVERLEKKLPKAARLFRSSAVERDLVAQAGKELGITLETLPPQVSYEVGKGLKQLGSLKGIKNPVAKKVLKDFDSKITKFKLNPKYEEKFRKQLTKLSVLPEEDLSPGAFKKFIMRTKKDEKFKVGDMHRMLKEIIDSPTARMESRVLAKDLWNLPITAPTQVAKASRTASIDVLLSQLQETPRVISAKMKDGYTLVRGYDKLRGVPIHKDVALELEAIKELPKISEQVFNKWFMTPWKTNKVIARPAAHIRNLFSNIILNDWGGLPFYRMDIYNDAIKGATSQAKSWKEFSRLTGVQATNFSSADLTQFTRGTKYGANIFEKGLALYDKVVAPARTLYGLEESVFKYAKYLHNLEKKMPKQEAALDAMKWTFNFSEVTPEVAKVGQYFIPFVRWYSKAIPLGLETAVKHPLRFGKWIGFYQAMQAHAIEDTGMDEDEWKSINAALPEYMQKGLYMLLPYRDDKDRLNMLDLTFTMPFFGDVSELMGQSPQDAILQNPVFTMASTLISKKKFSGAPLYYDWEPASTKFTKAMAYGWEQLMPSVLPGSTDFEKLYRAFTEEEFSMSPEVAVANAMGIKIAQIDHAVNLKRQRDVRKIHVREIQSAMKADLRRAQTAKEKDKVVQKYQKYRLDIWGVEEDEG